MYPTKALDNCRIAFFSIPIYVGMLVTVDSSRGFILNELL